MSKIEEAREILKELQVPTKQQADLCCFVLLAMASIKEQDLWANATNNWMRIHDIIAYTKENYRISYAENSRETFQNRLSTTFETLLLLRTTEKRQTVRITAII